MLVTRAPKHLLHLTRLTSFILFGRFSKKEHSIIMPNFLVTAFVDFYETTRPHGNLLDRYVY